MEDFNVGDHVKWESQSGGSTKLKCGKVVRVVVKTDCPAHIANHEFPNHKRMFDGLSLPGRNTQKAYLVEVFDGKTAMSLPKLYMPYPSKLKMA